MPRVLKQSRFTKGKNLSLHYRSRIVDVVSGGAEYHC